MKRWSARQLFALFLAVFVTVGMSLSAVQASGMATKTPMASGMSGAGHDGCQECSGRNGNDSAKVMVCASVCAAMVVAELPQPAPATQFEKPVLFTVRHAVLHGRASAPDPYPPRPIDIG